MPTPMTEKKLNNPTSLTPEEAEAALQRLRQLFGSGAPLEEVRAVFDVVTAPHALDSMSPYDRAMNGELIGEIAKFFLFKGRA